MFLCVFIDFVLFFCTIGIRQKLKESDKHLCPKCGKTQAPNRLVPNLLLRQCINRHNSGEDCSQFAPILRSLSNGSCKTASTVCLYWPLPLALLTKSSNYFQASFPPMTSPPAPLHPVTSSSSATPGVNSHAK
jgi:hypothetical protein